MLYMYFKISSGKFAEPPKVTQTAIKKELISLSAKFSSTVILEQQKYVIIIFSPFEKERDDRHNSEQAPGCR